MRRTQPQAAVQRHNTLVGQVCGLLGFSFVCTTVGALGPPRVGPTATSVGGIGALVVLLVLNVVRGLSPTLRFDLFPVFSVLQSLG